MTQNLKKLRHQRLFLNETCNNHDIWYTGINSTILEKFKFLKKIDIFCCRDKRDKNGTRLHINSFMTEVPII